MDNILNLILNKKFIIHDTFGINGSDWYLSFSKKEDKLVVTEESFEGKTKCHFCTYKSMNNNKLEIFTQTEGYSWMVTKDKNNNLEVWVSGHGGAMNFNMEEYSRYANFLNI